MRKIIAYEGMMIVGHNIVIDPGSIKMLDEQVPISFSYNWDKLVGWARDFQCNEKGEISVECDLFHEHDRMILEDEEHPYDANIYCDNITVKTNSDGVKHLLYGRLRGVGLMPKISDAWVKL